jgi:hypothetical protein
MSVPFEEVPPLSAGHKRRFEFADLHRCFPDASFTLLYRPSTPWAIAEEWHGPEPTPAPRTAAGVSTAGWRGTASRAAMTIPPTTRSRLERLARRVRRIGPSRSTN